MLPWQGDSFHVWGGDQRHLYTAGQAGGLTHAASPLPPFPPPCPPVAEGVSLGVLPPPSLLAEVPIFSVTNSSGLSLTSPT